MKLKVSEEGRKKILDALRKGQEAKKEKSKKLRVDYEENPKQCLHCGKLLPFEKKRSAFCSRSCSARFNNLGGFGGKNKIPNLTPNTCVSCGNQIAGKGKIYCSYKCQMVVKTMDIVEKGLAKTNKTFRRYLILTRGHRCEICGLTEWCGKETPLVLDHIDGNSENNDLDNLRMVCPNCDAQLPTYKSKNRGNGRASRRQRYADGKSY